MLTDIIDAELMKKLEAARIASRKRFPGAMKGKRRSTKRGSSVEFADYRDYQPGDDFRFIDWNIYSRLDKLFLKTFVEEENIYIHILLDVSASMSFGTPSKIEYGKRITAALSYIGLADLDTVIVTTFAEGLSGLRPMRGKDRIFTLLNFLEGLQSTAKRSDMDTCLKRYALTMPYTGVAIIISDFLVPKTNYEEGLKALIYKNFDINVIHVMSEEERNPTIRGELKLQDVETGETKEVTLTDRMLERYQKRLATFCGNLEQFCTRNNILYLMASTSLPFEELMLKTMRKEQMLL